jgi:hypothetical protein
MSASEIDVARRQLRARVETILSADELSIYDAYDDRIRAALAQGSAGVVEATAAEQAVLDKIAHDTQAAALDTQLLALLRVKTLPQ